MCTRSAASRAQSPPGASMRCTTAATSAFSIRPFTPCSAPSSVPAVQGKRWLASRLCKVCTRSAAQRSQSPPGARVCCTASTSTVLIEPLVPCAAGAHAEAETAVTASGTGKRALHTVLAWQIAPPQIVHVHLAYAKPIDMWLSSHPAQQSAPGKGDAAWRSRPPCSSGATHGRGTDTALMNATVSCYRLPRPGPRP